MKLSFLDQLVAELSEKYGEAISDLCIVLPTRRAGVFFRDALARSLHKVMWAPKIISIQDWIRELSGWQFPEPMPLVFELYGVYVQEMQKLDPSWEEPLEKFYAWGEMLMKDFDELDKYCVDAEQLFRNVYELKEIEAYFSLPPENLESLKNFWAALPTDGKSSPTEVQERFLKIWSVLYDIYKAYRNKLSNHKWAYDGMAYRYLADQFLEGKISLPYKKVIFASFNALSVAEERIMQALLFDNKGEVYWDADYSYYHTEAREKGQLLIGGEPGKFIRGYHNAWKERGSHLLAWDMAKEDKSITIAGISQNVGQARYLGQLLAEREWEGVDYRHTALVLAEEHLLFPVLYSLPPELDKLNITMGYPLRQTHVYHLLLTITALIRFMRVEKGQTLYPHQEVNDILSNPYVQETDSEWVNDILKQIRHQNLVWVSTELLKGPQTPALIKDIFSAPTEVAAMGDYIDMILESLLEDAQERKAFLEAEFIYHFHVQFNQLRTVLDTYRTQLSLWGFTRLFKEVMKKVRIPFEGEPLEGVQLMGFLETRVLDFDKVYILAANEGNLPNTSTGNSFIPYHLRKGFGMPTYEEKDAIFAYHFYRLLQRASEVHLIYDAYSEGSGAKEVSRFIRQIRHLMRDQKHIKLREITVSTPAPYVMKSSITIPAEQKISDLLREKYEGESTPGTQHLSATALNTYLRCPLRFYFRYVAGIKEPEKVEEIIEARTFGSVLHYAMENLYGPLQNTVLTPELLAGLKKKLPKALGEAFAKHGIPWQYLRSGKNYLLRDTIERLCEQIIDIDLESESFEVKYLEEERKFASSIEVGNGKYRINGTFDRVDFLPGKNKIRILDYKTGRVKFKKDLVIEDLFVNDDYKEAFQGYLYAWLFTQKEKQYPLSVGFYTVKNLKNGIQYLNDGAGIEAAHLHEFEKHLKELISRILQKDFHQVEDESKCRTCSYNTICNRGRN